MDRGNPLMTIPEFLDKYPGVIFWLMLLSWLLVDAIADRIRGKRDD